MGVTQKSWFRRNRFCRVTPAQFIRYLKSFHKANLDINKPLRLWVLIYTLFKFRTFLSAPATLSTEEQLLLFDLFTNEKALHSITDSKYCSSVIICRHRDKIFKKFSTLLKNYKDNILKKYYSLWTFCEVLNKFYKIQLKITIYIMRMLCHKKSTFIRI